MGSKEGKKEGGKEEKKEGGKEENKRSKLEVLKFINCVYCSLHTEKHF